MGSCHATRVAVEHVKHAFEDVSFLSSARTSRFVRTEQLTSRLREVQFESAALARTSPVRILTPDGFDGATALPVLYLLHGGGDDCRSWTDKGAAESVTDGLPLIVVMPDTGSAGWYSDWHSDEHNRIGPQRWETYHVHELRPWVEATFRTRTDRAGRTVVGLSMGGYGALKYAAPTQRVVRLRRRVLGRRGHPRRTDRQDHRPDGVRQRWAQGRPLGTLAGLDPRAARAQPRRPCREVARHDPRVANRQRATG